LPFAKGTCLHSKMELGLANHAQYLVVDESNYPDGEALRSGCLSKGEFKTKLLIISEKKEPILSIHEF